MPDRSRPQLYDVATRQPTRNMIEPDPDTVERFLHADHGFDFDEPHMRQPMPRRAPPVTASQMAARIMPLRKPASSGGWALGIGCLTLGVVVGYTLFPILSALARLFK